MIVKIRYSKADNKIYCTSKPSHDGRSRQFAVDYEVKATADMLNKLQGKNIAYFHAHMKEDTLVIDDKIEDQRW